MKTVSGQVTILTDNVVPGKSEAVGEHGLCMYLETGNGNFLFDTGRGKTIIHNATLYHKDLNHLNKIVLSHNHGDHTGGLPEVLRVVARKPIDVHAHQDIFAYRFRKVDGKNIYQGMPFTQGHLERMGARFVFNTGYVEIEDGIFLTGEVPRETPFEKADMEERYMVIDKDMRPDTIIDDQSMVIHTAAGLLIVLGCAHAGIVNVIRHVIKHTGMEKIFAVIGGTHIGFAGDAQLRESITALKSFQIQHFIPSHCTGPEAIARLRHEFADIFQFSQVGYHLAF